MNLERLLEYLKDECKRIETKPAFRWKSCCLSPNEAPLDVISAPLEQTYRVGNDCGTQLFVALCAAEGWRRTGTGAATLERSACVLRSR